MVIDMNESKLATLEQIREFLAGTSEVAFAIPVDEPRLRAFVAKVLQRCRHFSRPKGQRGVLFEYMQRLSGYSRQHLSRLTAQYRDTHSIEPATRASRTSFSRKYQPEDEASGAVARHSTLSRAHWHPQSPAPQGLSGYIRIDTVHQGDQDGVKGSTTSTRSISSRDGSW
jgi:hypothetical protein